MLCTNAIRHQRLWYSQSKGGPVERGELAHCRERTPWWRRERTKDLAVGFVLGVLTAGVAAWFAEKFGL